MRVASAWARARASHPARASDKKQSESQATRLVRSRCRSQDTDPPGFRGGDGGHYTDPAGPVRSAGDASIAGYLEIVTRMIR